MLAATRTGSDGIRFIIALSSSKRETDVATIRHTCLYMNASIWLHDNITHSAARSTLTVPKRGQFVPRRNEATSGGNEMTTALKLF